MITKKPYSFNTLASLIATTTFESDIIHLHKEEYEFSDATAEVTGTIKGYFSIQKQTYDNPPFCDLTDVYIEITSVVVSSDNFEKIFTLDEKIKLEETIKSIML